LRRGAPLVAFATASATASANVIFPAFTAPYVSPLLFPIAGIAVLAVEFATYKLIAKSLSTLAALVLVIAVNLISWLVGIALTRFLPDGLVKGERGIVTTGPDFFQLAILGFVVAYVLSVLVEAGALKVASYKWTIEAPLKLSFVANTASYLVLSGIVWLYT